MGSNTLFVRHLPSELAVADREELLKLVGATKVRCMSEGRLKYTAFASFRNHEEAKHALSILHQRKILNHYLIVEFAKQQHRDYVPHESDQPKFNDKVDKETMAKVPDAKEVLRLDMEEFSRKIHGVSPALGLDYLPSPLLKYKYPPPTPTIIENIAHALASVPKFYTQVLHLMNKMNLPAPFGPLTPAPPLAPNANSATVDALNEIVEQEATTPEESEIESDDDGEHKVCESVQPVKRSLHKPKQNRKKRKLQDLIPVAPNPNTMRSKTEASEVFESQIICPKKITMKNIEQIKTIPVTDQSVESQPGGFGAFDSSKAPSSQNTDNKEPSDEVWDDSQFITLKELKEKRLSSREMKTMSIFRNFSPGDPTFRLYIKNLAKQVEEKDLRFIFGNFIDRTSEKDRNMFDVRLMKEGRMKGQAFVTLADEKQAIEAVRQTNGFVLHTKPLVVQFARSAKPKDQKKEQKS